VGKQNIPNILFTRLIFCFLGQYFVYSVNILFSPLIFCFPGEYFAYPAIILLSWPIFCLLGQYFVFPPPPPGGVGGSGSPDRRSRPSQNPRILRGSWSGSAPGGGSPDRRSRPSHRICLRGRMAGFCAFKGRNVHLVQATAQFSQSGAHMQARDPKWPLKSVNLPN